MPFKQVIQEVQKDNYSKAEKWLGRVKQSIKASETPEEMQSVMI